MSSEKISSHTKGRQFAKFYEDVYQTKSPALEFIFQNSLGDDVSGLSNPVYGPICLSNHCQYTAISTNSV
jgi:hypothetical protein